MKMKILILSLAMGTINLNATESNVHYLRMELAPHEEVFEMQLENEIHVGVIQSEEVPIIVPVEVPVEEPIEEEVQSGLPVLGKHSDYRNVNWNSQTQYTADELDIYLSRGLKGMGDVYKRVEAETGVNALLLVAISAGESTHGTSRIAKDKNNLFGYGAYDSSPYESAVHFTSKEDGIRTVAKEIKSNYLTEGGKHYHGPTLVGMNVKYCSGNSWAGLMNDIVKSVDQKVKKGRG